MIAAKDIMLDDDNELIINNGDFEVKHSDGQHVKLILLSEKGAWRQQPFVGIGIRKLMNTKLGGLDRGLLQKRIASQLEYDSYAVKNIALLTEGKLSIDYERI